MISLSQDTHTVSLLTTQKEEKKKSSWEPLHAALKSSFPVFSLMLTSYELSPSERFMLEKPPFLQQG